MTDRLSLERKRRLELGLISEQDYIAEARTGRMIAENIDEISRSISTSCQRTTDILANYVPHHVVSGFRGLYSHLSRKK